MSEKMTVISLPGCDWPGFMDYGEVNAAKLIADVQKHAANEIQQLQQVVDADLKDFRIELVRGKVVQRRIKIIQSGK